MKAQRDSGDELCWCGDTEGRKRAEVEEVRQHVLVMSGRRLLPPLGKGRRLAGSWPRLVAHETGEAE